MRQNWFILGNFSIEIRPSLQVWLNCVRAVKVLTVKVATSVLASIVSP